jgi:hypothetical protein
MSGNHTLLEDFGPTVIHTLEGKRRYLTEGGKLAVAPSSPPDDPPNYKFKSRPPRRPPNNIIKYLLGLGAAGAGGYALRDKLGDAADEAGEHINSLRDKLANIIAAHHNEA